MEVGWGDTAPENHNCLTNILSLNIFSWQEKNEYWVSGRLVSHIVSIRSFGWWIVALEFYYDTSWNSSFEFHLHFSPFLIQENARESVPTINHCSRGAAFYICPEEARHHYHINCIFHDVILSPSNIQDGLLIQTRAPRTSGHNFPIALRTRTNPLSFR